MLRPSQNPTITPLHEISGLKLWTFEANHGAIRFYEAHGFTTSETTDGSRNEEHLPDRLMAWCS